MFLELLFEELFLPFLPAICVRGRGMYMYTG